MSFRSKAYCLADIKPYLTGAKTKTDGQVTATCPVCSKEGHFYAKEEGGKLLMFCQKCNAEFKDFCAEFKRLGAKPTGAAEEPVEDYDHIYRDASGNVMYYKNRKKYRSGDKVFSFYHFAGGVRQNTKPKDASNFYNLEKLAAAKPEETLYIVEGEKCADAMTRKGLLATTCNTGAQKSIKLTEADKEIFNKFKSKVLIPDNDDKGKFLIAAYAELMPRVLYMKDVWPQCPPKGDIADYFAKGLPVEAITNWQDKQEFNFDTLTAEQMIVAPTACNYLYSLTDAFERQQAENKAMLRAQALGVKTKFKQFWNAYLAKQAQAKGAVQNVTKFPNQKLVLNCGDWTCDESGVRRMKKSNFSGDIGYEYASHVPVMPTAILKNVDDDTERIRIAFWKNGVWSSLITERKNVANQSRIIDLVDLGLEVSSANAKLLTTYLAEIVTLNPDKFIAQKSINHLGWHGNEFVPYTDEFELDCESAFRTLTASVKEKGTLQEWINFIKPLMDKSMMLRLMIDASLASVLISRVNALPFIFHVWGGTGAGKTVGLMCAASVWGDPRMGHMIGNLNSTINAMMGKAGFLRNIPFFGDELQVIKEKYSAGYDQLIMRLCEGSDRERKTADGKQATIETWCNSFLFSGEEPCTQIESGGGAINRVLDIEVTEPVIEDGPTVIGFINEHYGTLGKAFVEAVQNYDPVKLHEEYKGIYQIMYGEGRTTEKQAMAASLVALADYLVKKCVFKEGDNPRFDDAVRVLQDICKSVAEVDVSERAWEFILGWISKNIKFFAQGSSWTNATETQQCYGMCRADYIYINKNILFDSLRERNFDFNAVKSGWKKKERLVLNSQGRYYHSASVQGIKGNYVVLRLPQ